MCKDVKLEIITRARLTRGLLNLLKDDIEMINLDATNYDLMTIDESICEAKDTIQKMIDNIMELEYLVYVTKNPDSR